MSAFRNIFRALLCLSLLLTVCFALLLPACTNRICLPCCQLVSVHQCDWCDRVCTHLCTAVWKPLGTPAWKPFPAMQQQDDTVITRKRKSWPWRKHYSTVIKEAKRARWSPQMHFNTFIFFVILYIIKYSKEFSFCKWMASATWHNSLWHRKQHVLNTRWLRIH